MGYAAIPYVIAALAAGGSAYSQHDTARRQDNEAAAGIRIQAEKQRQADERVNQELGTVATSTPDAERNAAQAQFMDQLRRVRTQADNSTPDVLGASGRYTTDVQDRTQSSDAQAGRIASLMSRINAPAQQRQREAQGFSQLSTDIGQIGRDSAGQDFLTQLRVRGIQRNPWIDALSSMGMAYAGGMASKAKPSSVNASQYVDYSPTTAASTRGLA